jgi:hypothetical protein
MSQTSEDINTAVEAWNLADRFSHSHIIGKDVSARHEDIGGSEQLCLDIISNKKCQKVHENNTVTTSDKSLPPTHAVLFDTMPFSRFLHSERLVWMQVYRHPCILVVELMSIYNTTSLWKVSKVQLRKLSKPSPNSRTRQGDFRKRLAVVQESTWRGVFTGRCVSRAHTYPRIKQGAVSSDSRGVQVVKREITQ